MNTEAPQSTSIVLCTYNGAAYLREQLESILAQTLPANEIIVQDDGSTDGTMEILYEYATRYRGLIKVYKNEGKHGVNANFVSAMSRTTGDYIAIADQDDIWEPNKMELQMQSIGDNMLCTGFSIPFTTSGAEIRVDRRLPNCSLLRQLYVGTVPGHTIVMTRKLLEMYMELVPVSDHRMYDAVLGIIAASHNKLIFVDNLLVNQRRHTDAATYTAPTDNRMTIGNVLRNITHSLKYYIELRPVVREQMRLNVRMLRGMRSNEQICADAIEMCELQSSSGILAFLRLQWFCLKHCNLLFHARADKKTVLQRLRALFFPISCSEYYRHLSKHSKER